MSTLALYLLLVLVLVASVVAVFAVFYERSSRQVSLVRTGAGGRKVAMDGGVLALPWFHEVMRVNMQTLRLEVRRTGEQSLITKDRLRVDVGAEFYVSVAPDADSVDRASQTLGERTFESARLHELLEGKLVDTLRSVAARMTMDELHERRAEFVSDVRAQLEASLGRNGLALESVSLTELDQTPFSSLDENNAFNAVGMRRLAEVIATARKERARIDRDAEVAVHRSSMEASKLKLEIDLEEQSARLAQTEQIETRRASQLTEIAARKADSERSIGASRIRMELAIRAEDIAREQAASEAEIASRRALEILEQERAIAIAERSRAQSEAQAAADTARAEAVRAAEGLITERALAEARRKKEVALVRAGESREIAAEDTVARARAESEAAVEQGRALREQAAAQAEATTLAGEARQRDMEARAVGQRALNEADNVLDTEQVALRRDMARLDALPGIIEQIVKPAEKIESIRVHSISGLGRSGDSSGGPGGDGAAAAPVNRIVDSILEMAVQLPAMRTLGKQVGISLDEGLAGIVTDEANEQDAGTRPEKR